MLLDSCYGIPKDFVLHVAMWLRLFGVFAWELLVGCQYFEDNVLNLLVKCYAVAKVF